MDFDQQGGRRLWQMFFQSVISESRSVADLEEAPPPPLFWVKKEEMTEEKKASRPSREIKG